MIDKSELVGKIRNFMADNRQILFLVGLYFIISLALSFYYPPYTDSNIHIIRAEFILENLHFPYDELAFNSEKAFVYPPVFHSLLALSKGIFGTWHVVSSLMASISILLTYKIVEIWYNHFTALKSALALAVFPLFFVWGLKVYVGTTVTAGFLLTFYLYFKYRETEERKLLYMTYIVGGSLFAVKTYGPLAPALISFHLLWERRNDLNEVLAGIKEIFWPGVIGVIFSLPWPIRNLLKAGSPVPKVTGNPLKLTTERAVEVSNLNILLPEIWEVKTLLIQFMGIRQSQVEVLLDIDPLIYMIWFIFPLSIIAVVSYGAVEEKDNLFIWSWLVSLVCLYFMGRVLSSAQWRLKTRHFITLSPVLALFAARAYERIGVKENWKEIGTLLIVIGMSLQVLISVGLTNVSTHASFEEVSNWMDESIPEDDIIYVQTDRRLAYWTETDFIFVSESLKPGYIDPRKNFSSEISEKADWAVITPLREEELEKLESAREDGAVELHKEIDSTRSFLWGDLGRVWRVYRVK